jgi:ligand-binding SRPBCC domain-containing protein
VRRFSHTFEVAAPIEKVWLFYTDISHLGMITPPEMKLRIVKCTTDRQIAEGTEVWLEGNLVMKSRWHSRITYLKPYVYIDEMLEGRFRVWKHTHTFEPRDTGTKVIDTIDFELPYGLLGKVLEAYVEKQLAKIFAQRKESTIRVLK